MKINSFFTFLQLPKIGNLKLGQEDKLSNQLAVFLRQKLLNGELKAVFTHIANEGAGKLAMIKKKHIGLVAGAPDWVICSNNKTLFIELKAGKNKQSKNQLFFESWCKDAGISYYLCYSLKECVTALQQEGFLNK